VANKLGNYYISYVNRGSWWGTATYLGKKAITKAPVAWEDQAIYGKKSKRLQVWFKNKADMEEWLSADDYVVFTAVATDETHSESDEFKGIYNVKPAFGTEAPDPAPKDRAPDAVYIWADVVNRIV
jgi:hypothetical protein